MTTTTNWRTMDAGRDLDWLIAQQLGWRIDVDPVHVDTFAYFAPDGSVSEDARMLSQEGVRNWRYSRLFPSYSTDLNAAFVLLKQMPLGAIYIQEDRTTWACNAYMDGAGVLTERVAFEPALAICQAWLVWKERHS